MSYIQQYLPIIATESKKVHGLYNLGSNITFSGTETKYPLAAGFVTLTLWKPTSAKSLIRNVNPAFMAAIWGHTDVYNRAYRGFAEFVELRSVYPTFEVGSSSGLGNFVRQYKGPILEGLSDSFGVGVAAMVPFNTSAPLLSGTVSSTNTLTSSNGAWNVTPASFQYQWYRNEQPIEGATASTYAILVQDIGARLYCTVWALNTYGVSQPKYSNTVIALS